MTVNRIAASLLSLTLLASEAPAQTPAPPWPSEVTIPSSRKIAFTSHINGEDFTLQISIPFSPPPKSGYPVIYILDGEGFFGAAADMALGMPRKPPVIVAIGHGLFENMNTAAKYAGRKPDDGKPVGLPDIAAAMQTLRMHDFTLPVAPDHRAPDWTGLTPSNVGGLDDFLRIIEDEIKPKVSALVPIDKSNQAIFGHSIAGMAVLRALLTEPAAFRTFIAASPSIWWDADAVLTGEAKFSTAVKAATVAPRLMLTVGANEPDSPNPPASFMSTLPADRAAELTAYVKMASHWSGMVSGSRNLADRFAKLQDGTKFEVRFVSFADESHNTAAFAALNRGMHFAFSR